jgi:hypothetical protein
MIGAYRIQSETGLLIPSEKRITGMWDFGRARITQCGDYTAGGRSGSRSVERRSRGAGNVASEWIRSPKLSIRLSASRPAARSYREDP